MSSVAKHFPRRPARNEDGTPKIDPETGKRIWEKSEDFVWRARYRDEAGKQHAKHFQRKVDAQKWLDEVTASVVVGNYVDPKAGKITFRKWGEKWIASQDWADGTAESAAVALDSATFADVPIKMITETHINSWLKSMRLPAPTRKGGLAASTRRTRFNFVRMCFAAAVRLKVIQSDPTDSVKAPRVPSGETKMKIPTAAQVGAAVKAAPIEFRAFVAVCAFAGLRIGEAAGLQVGDVDFLRKQITVERQIQGNTTTNTSVESPKYESGRTVHVPEALIAILSEHVRTLGTLGDEGWLFSWAGRVLNRNSAGNQWRKLRAQIGAGEFTLHDLRHFYASGLIAAGCDVVTVQHALGHKSPSITLGVYSHLWPKADERTRAAAEDLMTAALEDSGRTFPEEPAADKA